jgi:hypothetical protein
MKKVLFLGSSNTFGVGLHTFKEKYLTEEGIKEINWPYNQSGEDNEFIYSVRWTGLVADHLHRNEINVAEAGGSPAESLHRLQNTDLSDTDYIFFEFSGIYNYFDRYFHNDEYPKTPHEIEAFLTNGKNDRPELRQRILDWLDKYNPNEFIDEVLILLKEKIEQLNNKKIIVLFWHGDLDFNNEKYSWLKKYMVKFPTNQNQNNYIVHNWVLENNYRVCDEHPMKEFMYPDIHAGVKGNKHISKIVINHINEKETTNSWR